MSLGELAFGAVMIFAGLKKMARGIEGLGEALEPDYTTPRRALAGTKVVRQIGAHGEKLKATYMNLTSINDRVGKIVELIRAGSKDELVRQTTLAVLGQKCGTDWCVPEKDYVAEVEAIFKAVRDKVRYNRDPYNMDAFQHPRRTLEWGGGDCDCLSALLGSMLMCVGYPVMLRVIQTKQSSEWDHIYCLVGFPPQNPTVWMALDASVNEPAGWQAPEEIVAKHKDFEV